MRRLLLALLVGLLCAPGTLAADAPPALTFVSPPSALVFEEKGQQEAATINVLLQNTAQSGGQLQITFIPDGRPPLTAISLSDFVARDPSVALVLRRPMPTDLTIDGASVTSISAALWRPLDADQPSSGQLVVRLGGTPPLGPAVAKLTEKEEPPLVFAQKSVTLSVTRLLGPLSRPVGWLFDSQEWRETLLYAGETAKIGTRGETPNTASALLNSDSGGTATVSLKRENGSRSVITATTITRHGKYSGDLTLDPDSEKPKTLTTGLNVHDLILWPLLFLLAGSWVAALLVKKHDIRRGRGLVQKAIKESVDPYRSARTGNDQQKPPDPPNRFYLDGLLPTDGLPYPSRGSCDGVILTEVEELYCRTYKADNDEALGELVALVEETTARFDRWLKVEKAVKLVKDEMALLPSDSPMRADASSMLVLTRQEPDDDKEAGDQVALLRTEARIAALYRHVRKAYDDKGDPWKKAHPLLEPNEAIKLLGPAGERTDPTMEKVELRLLTIAEALRDPSRVEETEETLSELLNNRSCVQMYLAAPEALQVEIAAKRSPRPTVDTRSPELIYAQVRRADWVVFWVAAALTALVYIGQQYDADYGSFEDYLLAFAAGAAVPTAVNWALLPFTRSYRVAAKKAAEPASTES